MNAGLLWALIWWVGGSAGEGPARLSGEAQFTPSAAEADVPELFRLEAARFPYEMTQLRRTERLEVWSVRFPSPIESPDPVNNTVHAEYFRPVGAGPESRRPGVVVLHILGADFPLARYVAARLADRGVAALFVKLPYYGERRPPGARFLSIDMARSVAAMRQGVCDVRRAAAWLASCPEIDPTKLGVTGISLGGIISALAAAVDPELNRAVLLLAGGGLADILWEMPEGRPYRAAWLLAGKTKADLEEVTRPLDPLTYAARLRPKRVLMLNGRVDEVISPEAATRLWDAAGRPPIEWFDCGHYSAAGYLLPGIRKAVAFFARDLPEG
jgi:dienelactone hydrolase